MFARRPSLAPRPVAFALTLTLLAALAACRPTPVAAPPPSLHAAPSRAPLAIGFDASSAARIAADVGYLASPALGGRGTGEPGARLAADFVAKRFADLHLAPLGDGEGASRSYLQAFSARAGADVGPASLVVTPSPQTGGAAPGAVVAAEGSASGAVSGKAMFVGYGITALAVGWDDYAAADLQGKIAVVLAGAPRVAAPATAARKQGGAGAHGDDVLHDFGTVRYKLRTAREHHAAGVVIVAAGEELPALAEDASSMGLPAVVMKRSAAAAAFAALGLADKGVWEPKQAAPPTALAQKEVALTTRIEPREVQTWNVAAVLPGRDGENGENGATAAREYIVVGAHYDHLGHGGTSASLAPGVRAIHPGADDNASGTALMLEVARRFTELPGRPARTLIFLSFGGEELGTLGSRHWVEHPPVPRASIAAMINADMVGRLRDDTLMVEGTGTATGWEALIRAANDGIGLDLHLGAEGFGASDHASFTAARIPVAFFFTGAHDDYHRPSDTADKINAAGEAKIAALAARLALAVAESKERLAFTDTPSDPHAGMRGGFKVSLGTLPDYGYQGKGLRLTGVRPDAPAARAGIKAGDVVVKVGSHEITNIHDYMFALGELEPGREATIEVLRDGVRLALKVIPAPGR